MLMYGSRRGIYKAGAQSHWKRSAARWSELAVEVHVTNCKHTTDSELKESFELSKSAPAPSGCTSPDSDD